MRPEVLQRQLPDVQQQEKVETNDSSLSDFALPLTLEACRCPHLEVLLPHVLDLKCVKNSETKKWQIANPVHALHLTSHMGPDRTSINIGQKDAMIYYQALYGEEQRRTNAIIQGGMTGSYCPLEIPYRGGDNRYSNLESKIKQQAEVPPTVVSGSHGLRGAGGKTNAELKSATVQIQSSSSGKGIGKKDIKRPTGSGDSTKQKSVMEKTAESFAKTPSSIPRTDGPKYGTHLTKHGHIGKMASIHPHGKNIPIEIPSSSTGKSAQNKKTGQVGIPTAVNSAGLSETAADETTNTDESNKADLPGVASYIPPSECLLSDARYQQLRAIEERITKQQKAIFSKRKLDQDDMKSSSSKKKSPSTSSKKRKNGSKTSIDKSEATGSSRSASTVFLPFESALHLSDFLDKEKKRILQLGTVDKENWEKDAAFARNKLEEWMQVFRQNRQSYWDEYEQQQSKKKGAQSNISYLNSTSFGGPQLQCCSMCNSPDDFEWNIGRTKNKSQCSTATGDELLQCLECSFIGCAPACIAPESSQHIIQHFIETNHSFGVTCGPRADLFCFRCGDFVYHEVFEQEKERIALAHHFPWMSWNLSPVQRSFDPLQFLTTPEHGVVWRGLVATYPRILPNEYLTAANRSMDRLLMFQGELESKKMTWGREALWFATRQNLLGVPEKWRLTAPIGMYNLGNTCFMSSVIQCLIHCAPLQRYFLGDIGHHHETCGIIRRYMNSIPQVKSNVASKAEKRKVSNSGDVCLACEMDIIFLKYYGRTVGEDVCRAIQDPKSSQCAPSGNDQPDIKGEPLIVSDILTAAWRTGDMDHLAGYEQRDAHEFLQAFLDIMGKHISQHRKRVRSIPDGHGLSNTVGGQKGSAHNDENIIKNLFEGILRSVLICEECGCKRSLSETFLNISLPLSKEMERSSSRDDRTIGTRGSRSKITVQKCLRHFTAPEALGDPVHCTSCNKKTSTKKQHTFSKLPRILCLHLKRFDAANNKKIDDFVSFPAHDLDMGPHLPHWCEVVQGTKEGLEDDRPGNGEFSSPQILYDLFGTVNHVGNLHQGHYTTNVKVGNQWFNCNDAVVSKSGEGDGERAVLKSEGAYVLFYIRR